MSINEGRVAMITGAGSGIGREISLELAKSKVKVVVCDISGENADAVVNEIKELGGEAVAAIGDVGNAENSQQMVQTALDLWGRLDILVNNAGIIRDATIMHMSEKKWDQVHNVIGKGAFLCTQAAAKPMIEQKFGRIVNMSSGAYLGSKGQANYSSAKAGLVAFTKVAALEFAEHNITVNCIAPGLIKTPLTSGLPEEVWHKLERSIPLGYVGDPKDIAFAVLSLVAEEARYITGQVIHVDGGGTTGVRL